MKLLKSILASILFMSFLPVSVSAETVLTCTINDYSIQSINQEGQWTVVGCAANLSDAKKIMNDSLAQYPDLVITHNASRSPLKIVATNRGIVTSYPQRTGTSTSNSSTMDIFRNSNFSGDTTYVPAYVDMAYVDTLSFDIGTGRGVVQTEISGFKGFTQILQLDIIPLIYVEKNWLISLGGRTFAEENNTSGTKEAVRSVVARMNEYRVAVNSTYKVNEITHATWNARTGSFASYTYGLAPEWLPIGTYYSWDSIHFFYDKAMKEPVLNGEKVGQYYNYYQYLPVRSASLYDGKVLDDYMKALGYTEKATVFPRTSSTQTAMHEVGGQFVSAQNIYGINSLLMFALAIHESGAGTSRLAIEKNNLFGWGAIDSNPSDAHMFESIEKSIYEHAGINLRGFISVENWRYFGVILGNKNNGMNTKYASDPYWGHKIAGWAYRIDRYNNFQDFNKYQIGIIEDNRVPHIKPTMDANSTTLHTIAERTQQRVMLINSIHTVNGKQWVQIMSSQPITPDGVVIRLNSHLAIDNPLRTTGQLIQYTWYSSVGYIQTDQLNIIYAGDGIHKIPRVYNAKEFEKPVISDTDAMVISSGKLTFNGYGIKPGVSIPYTTNVSFKLLVSTNNQIAKSYSLSQGLINPSLTTAFGSGQFEYDGATYQASNIDLTSLPVGTYTLSMEGVANTLAQPTVFAYPLTTSKTLPSLSVFNKRSYEFKKLENQSIQLTITATDSNDTDPVTNPDPEPEPEPVILKGDVNGDGIVNVLDLARISRFLAELEQLSELSMKAADINDDGIVNVLDLARLSRILAELE